MAQYFNSVMEECNENVAEYVLLNVKEYNGLRKVLRLYQAIKKGNNNENNTRYKVMEQQIQKHQDDRSKFMEWQTTLLTPYFDDLGYEEVKILVQHDLEQYFGVIAFVEGAFDVSIIETRASMIAQNYRLGKLEDEEYGIFYAALRFNGRNVNWELKIKSMKRIPFEVIKSIQ